MGTKQSRPVTVSFDMECGNRRKQVVFSDAMTDAERLDGYRALMKAYTQIGIATVDETGVIFFDMECYDGEGTMGELFDNFRKLYPSMQFGKTTNKLIFMIRYTDCIGNHDSLALLLAHLRDYLNKDVVIKVNRIYIDEDEFSDAKFENRHE